MATFALTDYDLSVAGKDLSAWVQNITLTASADELDDTAMGDTTRSRIGGLKDWSVSVTFTQDHAAGGPDAILGGTEGTTDALILKPTSGSVTSTNPSYSGTGLLVSYQPVGNSVGDLAQAQATWNAAGALSRNTS